MPRTHLQCLVWWSLTVVYADRICFVWIWGLVLFDLFNRLLSSFMWSWFIISWYNNISDSKGCSILFILKKSPNCCFDHYLSHMGRPWCPFSGTFILYRFRSCRWDRPITKQPSVNAACFQQRRWWTVKNSICFSIFSVGKFWDWKFEKKIHHWK